MDRSEIARAVRRRQALEAIEDERDRERALADQLHEIVTEADGPGIDGVVFATMEPTEVKLVREVFGEEVPDTRDELEPFDLPEEDEEEESIEDEIVRLEREVRLCQRRVRALERYIEGLDAVAVDGDTPA